MATINVTSAVYGAEPGSFDVTAKVQALVAISTTFEVNNNNFGDPCVNTSKYFGMTYTVDGVERAASAPEGQKVTLNTQTPALYTIIGAVYGALQGSSDVTATVQALVDQKTDSFTAGNAIFGDPSVGNSKMFAMAYKEPNGKAHTIACQEGQTVKIG